MEENPKDDDQPHPLNQQDDSTPARADGQEICPLTNGAKPSHETFEGATSVDDRCLDKFKEKRNLEALEFFSSLTNDDFDKNVANETRVGPRKVESSEDLPPVSNLSVEQGNPNGGLSDHLITTEEREESDPINLLAQTNSGSEVCADNDTSRESLKDYQPLCHGNSADENSLTKESCMSTGIKSLHFETCGLSTPLRQKWKDQLEQDDGKRPKRISISNIDCLNKADGITPSSSRSRSLCLMPSIDEGIEEEKDNIFVSQSSASSSCSSLASSPGSKARHDTLQRVSSKPTLTSISEELVCKTDGVLKLEDGFRPRIDPTSMEHQDPFKKGTGDSFSRTSPEHSGAGPKGDSPSFDAKCLHTLAYFPGGEGFVDEDKTVDDWVIIDWSNSFFRPCYDHETIVNTCFGQDGRKEDENRFLELSEENQRAKDSEETEHAVTAEGEEEISFGNGLTDTPAGDEPDERISGMALKGSSEIIGSRTEECNAAGEISSNSACEDTVGNAWLKQNAPEVEIEINIFQNPEVAGLAERNESPVSDGAAVYSEADAYMPDEMKRSKAQHGVHSKLKKEDVSEDSSQPTEYDEKTPSGSKVKGCGSASMVTDNAFVTNETAPARESHSDHTSVSGNLEKVEKDHKDKESQKQRGDKEKERDRDCGKRKRDQRDCKVEESERKECLKNAVGDVQRFLLGKTCQKYLSELRRQDAKATCRLESQIVESSDECLLSEPSPPAFNLEELSGMEGYEKDCSHDTDGNFESMKQQNRQGKRKSLWRAKPEDTTGAHQNSGDHVNCPTPGDFECCNVRTKPSESALNEDLSNISEGPSTSVHSYFNSLQWEPTPSDLTDSQGDSMKTSKNRVTFPATHAKDTSFNHPLSQQSSDQDRVPLPRASLSYDEDSSGHSAVAQSSLPNSLEIPITSNDVNAEEDLSEMSAPELSNGEEMNMKKKTEESTERSSNTDQCSFASDGILTESGPGIRVVEMSLETNVQETRPEVEGLSFDLKIVVETHLPEGNEKLTNQIKGAIMPEADNPVKKPLIGFENSNAENRQAIWAGISDPEPEETSFDFQTMPLANETVIHGESKVYDVETLGKYINMANIPKDGQSVSQKADQCDIWEGSLSLLTGKGEQGEIRQENGLHEDAAHISHTGILISQTGTNEEQRNLECRAENVDITEVKGTIVRTTQDDSLSKDCDSVISSPDSDNLALKQNEPEIFDIEIEQEVLYENINLSESLQENVTEVTQSHLPIPLLPQEDHPDEIDNDEKENEIKMVAKDNTQAQPGNQEIDPLPDKDKGASFPESLLQPFEYKGETTQNDVVNGAFLQQLEGTADDTPGESLKNEETPQKSERKEDMQNLSDGKLPHLSEGNVDNFWSGHFANEQMPKQQTTDTETEDEEDTVNKEKSKEMEVKVSTQETFLQSVKELENSQENDDSGEISKKSEDKLECLPDVDMGKEKQRPEQMEEKPRITLEGLEDEEVLKRSDSKQQGVQEEKSDGNPKLSNLDSNKEINVRSCDNHENVHVHNEVVCQTYEEKSEKAFGFEEHNTRMCQRVQFKEEVVNGKNGTSEDISEESNDVPEGEYEEKLMNEELTQQAEEISENVCAGNLLTGEKLHQSDDGADNLHALDTTGKEVVPKENTDFNKIGTLHQYEHTQRVAFEAGIAPAFNYQHPSVKRVELVSEDLSILLGSETGTNFDMGDGGISQQSEDKSQGIDGLKVNDEDRATPSEIVSKHVTINEHFWEEEMPQKTNDTPGSMFELNVDSVKLSKENDRTPDDDISEIFDDNEHFVEEEMPQKTNDTPGSIFELNVDSLKLSKENARKPEDDMNEVFNDNEHFGEEEMPQKTNDTPGSMFALSVDSVKLSKKNDRTPDDDISEVFDDNEHFWEEEMPQKTNDTSGSMFELNVDSVKLSKENACKPEDDINEIFDDNEHFGEGEMPQKTNDTSGSMFELNVDSLKLSKENDRTPEDDINEVFDDNEHFGEEEMPQKTNDTSGSMFELNVDSLKLSKENDRTPEDDINEVFDDNEHFGEEEMPQKTNDTSGSMFELNVDSLKLSTENDRTPEDDINEVFDDNEHFWEEEMSQKTNDTSGSMFELNVDIVKLSKESDRTPEDDINEVFNDMKEVFHKSEGKSQTHDIDTEEIYQDDENQIKTGDPLAETEMKQEVQNKKDLKSDKMSQDGDFDTKINSGLDAAYSLQTNKVSCTELREPLRQLNEDGDEFEEQKDEISQMAASLYKELLDKQVAQLTKRKVEILTDGSPAQVDFERDMTPGKSKEADTQVFDSSGSPGANNDLSINDTITSTGEFDSKEIEHGTGENKFLIGVQDGHCHVGQSERYAIANATKCVNSDLSHESHWPDKPLEICNGNQYVASTVKAPADQLQSEGWLLATPDGAQETQTFTLEVETCSDGNVVGSEDKGVFGSARDSDSGSDFGDMESVDAMRAKDLMTFDNLKCLDDALQPLIDVSDREEHGEEEERKDEVSMPSESEELQFQDVDESDMQMKFHRNAYDALVSPRNVDLYDFHDKLENIPDIEQCHEVGKTKDQRDIESHEFGLSDTDSTRYEEQAKDLSSGEIHLHKSCYHLQLSFSRRDMMPNSDVDLSAIAETDIPQHHSSTNIATTPIPNGELSTLLYHRNDRVHENQTGEHLPDQEALPCNLLTPTVTDDHQDPNNEEGKIHAHVSVVGQALPKQTSVLESHDIIMLEKSQVQSDSTPNDGDIQNAAISSNSETIKHMEGNIPVLNPTAQMSSCKEIADPKDGTPSSEHPQFQEKSNEDSAVIEQPLLINVVVTHCTEGQTNPDLTHIFIEKEPEQIIDLEKEEVNATMSRSGCGEFFQSPALHHRMMKDAKPENENSKEDIIPKDTLYGDAKCPREEKIKNKSPVATADDNRGPLVFEEARKLNILIDVDSKREYSILDNMDVNDFYEDDDDDDDDDLERWEDDDHSYGKISTSLEGASTDGAHDGIHGEGMNYKLVDLNDLFISQITPEGRSKTLPVVRSKKFTDDALPDSVFLPSEEKMSRSCSEIDNVGKLLSGKLGEGTTVTSDGPSLLGVKPQDVVVKQKTQAVLKPKSKTAKTTVSADAIPQTLKSRKKKQTLWGKVKERLKPSATSHRYRHDGRGLSNDKVNVTRTSVQSADALAEGSEDRRAGEDGPITAWHHPPHPKRHRLRHKSNIRRSHVRKIRKLRVLRLGAENQVSDTQPGMRRHVMNKRTWGVQGSRSHPPCDVTSPKAAAPDADERPPSDKADDTVANSGAEVFEVSCELERPNGSTAQLSHTLVGKETSPVQLLMKPLMSGLSDKRPDISPKPQSVNQTSRPTQLIDRSSSIKTRPSKRMSCVVM